ncbi:MAG: glucosaminidase domain-containing protein [Enterobacteriaceae bacterium]
MKTEIALPPWFVEWRKTSKRDPDFDQVIRPATPIKIDAGQPVGFMGLNQLPEMTGMDSAWRVHLEVFTPDDKIKTFIGNPLKLKGGRQFARYSPGKPRYSTADKKTFVLQTTPTRYTGIAPLLSDSRVTIKATEQQPAIEYCRIEPEGGWVKTTDLEILSQYDLEKLGFFALDGCEHQTFEHLSNVQKPTRLISDIIEHLKKQAEQGNWIYCDSLAFDCQLTLNKIDILKENEYHEPDKFRQIIQHGYFHNAVRKMIVKHPSEWHDKSTDPMWAPLLKQYEKFDSDIVYYNQDVIDKCVWMQEVPEFAGKKEVWHMHPVVFLWYLKEMKTRVRRPLHVQDFLNMASPSAKTVSTQWGVPASVLLAQSALESGWGQHVRNNAYFGIKGVSPTGNSVSFRTTEVINGNTIQTTDHM